MKVFTVKVSEFIHDEEVIGTFYFAKEENALAKINEIRDQIKTGNQKYSDAWLGNCIITEDE